MHTVSTELRGGWGGGVHTVSTELRGGGCIL